MAPSADPSLLRKGADALRLGSAAGGPAFPHFALRRREGGLADAHVHPVEGCLTDPDGVRIRLLPS